MRKPLIALLLAGSLTACDREAREGLENEDIPPATDETADPVEKPVSIIRDDVREEMEEEGTVAEEAVRATIGFPDGGSKLTDSARRALDTLASDDMIASDDRIRLWGHSDTVGSDDANFRAGTARAEAVADYLVDKGVARARITIVSLGEGNPAQPNYLPDGSDNVDGQKANRRVDILIGKDTAADATKGVSRSAAETTDRREVNGTEPAT